MSRGTISGILSILTGKLGGLFLGILITPIIVRILGAGQYGDYALVLSVYTVGTTLTHAGISAGIRKYIAEERSEQGWKDQVFSFYIRFGFTLAVTFSVVMIILGLYGPVEVLFGDQFRLYFVLLGLMLICNQLFYIHRYTLIGLKYEYISESLVVLKHFLYGLFGILLAYIGYDVAGVLAGTAIASFVCGVIAIWALRDKISLRAPFSAVPTTFPSSDLLSFNVHNTIFVLLTISLYNVDILLLQPIAGSQQTGLYKAALIIAEFMWLVPTAIQIIFIGSASKQWSKNNPKAITEMASRATRFTLAFTVLLIIELAALSTEFMTLYFGTEFADAALPLLILLPGVLGFAVARPIFAIGQGKGALRILIAATGSAALINLLLNIVLIPRYGMVGAAVATSIGYGSMLVFHVVAARKIGFNPLVDLRLARIGATGLITAVVVFGTASVIESTILSLIIVPPVGFVTYLVLSLKLEVATPEEVELLADQLPSQLGTLVTQTGNRLQ